MQHIDHEARNSIISAFNQFDTGYTARSGTTEIMLPFLSGRLHKTFVVRDITANGGECNKRKYVVQRLSFNPFDLGAVEHMIQLLDVAQQIAEAQGAFAKGGPLEGWNQIIYYNVKGGSKRTISGISVGQKILYGTDEHGKAAWRIMEFVEGQIFDKLTDIGSEIQEPEVRRQGQLSAATLFGEAMAKFVILVNFIPKETSFMDTLPGFHDTEGYIQEVNALLSGNTVKVRPGTGELEARLIDGIRDGYQNGKYKARVQRMVAIFEGTSALGGVFKGLPETLQKAFAHGDLKVNNVIWATDKLGRPEQVKCFIDLDTIGIYTALDDFGDAARSIINVLGESIWMDEKTLEDIVLDQEVLESLVTGYMKGIRKLCEAAGTDELRLYLLRSVAVYFFQLGTRFLKSFLSELENCPDGDNNRHFVYFLRHSERDLEDTNLRLAEVQYTALLRYLNDFKNDLGLEALNIRLAELPTPLGWHV